jgi:APA family basic amino acid/polyamine antiporter
VTPSARTHRILVRKPLSQVQSEVESHGMNRTLGPLNLVSLGVGCVIGAGIFVLTGNAAAQFAGPAVVLSFVIAGVACAFTGLCYAELASALPASGSAYTYSYATLGEAFAWLTGWLMALELGIAAALVAVGFSGYSVSLLRDFGISIPTFLTRPYIDSAQTAAGLPFTTGNGFNLIAALGVIGVTALLIRGVSQSAAVNTALVFLKVGVLLAFVAIGVWFIEPLNWTPFVPPNEGGFTYGWQGVARAAPVIFFAYIGFETVATAAAEARNPRRDVPIGIIGSLVLCTILYIAVAAVLTGVVPFRSLNVPDPMSIAVDAIGLPWFGLVVKVGAVLGLSSVMLTSMYGQTRVAYAMSRDGLLPELFSRVHARLRTPHLGTLVTGGLIALTAGFLPITILTDLVSLGTSLCFGIVCLTVIWLRSAHPQLERKFRVPFGGIRIGKVWLGVVPVLGMACCVFMVVPLFADIIGKALRGDRIPALMLVGYLSIGTAIYFFYGIRHSKLGMAHGKRAAGISVPVMEQTAPD